nr:Aminotransferase-like mobile domain containing protein [Ipomoea batatas]GME09498.1 Aminotransferase-like mobile domain containing protein [Ipomoea batatas]
MGKSSRRSSILQKDGVNAVGNFSTRFSLPSFVKRVKKLSEAQKEAVRRAGFGNLLLIPNQMLCKNLLVELMERWNCDKSAFVLPHGEITISLMDVVLILGLRVTGNPVSIGDNTPFLNLERGYGAVLWNRKITVASVEERLESLGETDDDDFLRLFLLYMFGTLLFPTTNGKIDSRYVYLLRDVDNVDQFAWGSAVLEDLFYWLSKRKRDNVQYVGGCLIFLQIWCYEHIDIARPCLIDNAVKFPRVCHWGSTKSHQRQWFIDKFKTLGSNQIIWSLELTSEESEIGMIKELLKAQGENAGQIMEQQSSAHVCNMVEQLAVDMEMDSATTISRELYQEQNDCWPLRNDNCEEDLKRKNWILEEQVTELRKEIDDLKRENKVLNNQLSSCLEFEKKNGELRKEVESLRQENLLLSSSAHTLVARLERIVLDGNTDTVDVVEIDKLLGTAGTVD